MEAMTASLYVWCFGGQLVRGHHHGRAFQRALIHGQFSLLPLLPGLCWVSSEMLLSPPSLSSSVSCISTVFCRASHCQGSHPFASFSQVVRAISKPPFPPCTPGLILMTSASMVSLASSVLTLLSIGLVVITLDLSYLPSPNPFLSYLFPLFYHSLLFVVWRMVAPATPSHSILVPLFPCLTQVNMVRVLVCVPTV
jgi:hypothetical protein